MTDEVETQGIEKLEIFGNYLGKSHEIHDYVNDIKNAQVVQISKSLKARKLNPPEVHKARAILPASGRKISVKQKSEQIFILRAAPQKEATILSNDSDFATNKIELSPETLDDFLALLRLVQLGLIAQSSRYSRDQIDKKHPVPLSKFVIEAIEGLDSFVNGRSDKNELNENLVHLENYHKMWLEKFNDSVNNANLSLNTNNSGLDVKSPEYESLFCSSPTTSDIIRPRDYLNEALDSSITPSIQEVLFAGLQQMFVIESPRVQDTEVSWFIPPLTLKLQTDDDLYASQKTEAKRLLSLLGTDDGETRNKVREIISTLEGKNDIKKLIDNPPSKISAQLNTILLGGNFDDIIRERLDTQVPGVTKYLNEQDESRDLTPKEIFTMTEYLRNEMVILETVLARIDKQIEALRSGKGGQVDANRLQTTWSKHRGDLQRVRMDEQSIPDAKKKVDALRTKILNLEGRLKRAQTNVKTDGSVLWLGLGQAGQAILRECLMYCLDNLNDARCGALIRSLGIDDLNALNDMVLHSKAENVKVQQKAETQLRNLFHKQLHILAMNLGKEIDKLVMEGEPGYYLWGNEVPESDYSTVRRQTMNTIKLDPNQDGAGGKTGVGRAFAFGRVNELKDALRDTGSKNGNTPSHIIVTHSFAGGSGSGMVLPVLQLLRAMFDSDAMIWVVSVGEGLAEQKISADYNTPFILSDVLQAHYDGIHAAIDPFLVGEWTGYQHELKQSQIRMWQELDSLKGLFSDNSEKLSALEVVDRNKSLQIKRTRSEAKSTLQRLISDVGVKIFPRWKTDKLDDDPYDFLPTEDEETMTFNSWCDEYDENGERPALKFWNAYVNHIADPLGAVVDCREKGKQQQNEAKSTDEYVPNITSAHIELALTEAHSKVFPPELAETGESVDDDKRKERQHQNLRILVMYLSNQIELGQDTATKKKLFTDAKQILMNYGREVDAYNTLRRNLTNRIKSLSKAGNDRGVKNIVISNAHLERGVAKSGIPVEENTYTVYNAVVFDVIMNIIGSQLPSTDYISGKTEYFDRTDLDNHSLPPMAVGLLQQNDAMSLAEPPAASLESSESVKSIHSNIHCIKLFEELFSSSTVKLVDELLNPFASNNFTMGGKPSMFFESYFGIRTQSMLHINPYDVIGVSPSKELKELTDAIKQNWDKPGKNIANIGFDERQSFLNDGFSSQSLVNMLRWLSLLEPGTLKSCMGVKDFINLERTEAIRAKLPSGFVFSESEKNFELTRYEYESGTISLTDYGDHFTKLGILNEELLAFAPPALLNSYLPQAILSNRSEEILEAFVQESGIASTNEIQAALRSQISLLSEHYQPNNVFNPEKIPSFMKIAKAQTPALKRAFSKVNLQIGILEEDHKETIEIRLHPRMTRYFSVFRDVVSKKSKYLFPSNSVAGSFARYLASDSNDSVIGTYSSPTFSRASEDMERLAFIGLLPDEKRLSWPSFLRMVLFFENDSEIMNTKLKPLADSIGIDLSEFMPLIEDVARIFPLQNISRSGSSGPDSVVSLAKTILDRMRSLGKIEEKYRRSRPVEESTIAHWKARVKELSDRGIEVFDESSTRFLVQLLLQLVMEDTTPVLDEQAVEASTSLEEVDGKTIEDDTNNHPSETSVKDFNELNDDAVSLDRLLYEIATNLSEMLSQAEYMSKEHTADRVHFKMSGFSDRLVGKPKGLLIQVHTASTYRENFDMARTAIRSSIQQSVGLIPNTKEFQTKSNFGPRASVTISLSQSPLNEAATTYRGLMKKLAGTDPDSFIEETKLHPYVFLYNVLWLSARLDKWTNLENTAFARRFVIPLQVIQDHYSKPGRIEGAVNALVKDSIYLKGVSLPQTDIRDYTSSRKPKERYRSIPHLVSLLALRHFNTCNELVKQTNDDQFKDEVQRIKANYSDEINDLSSDPVISRAGEAKRGESAYTLLLEDEDLGSHGDEKSSTPDSVDPMAALMTALGQGDDSSSASDTILERTKAWFEAHKAWNQWADGKVTMDEED